MQGPNLFGDERLDAETYDLVRLEAEKPPDSLARKDDDPVSVDGDDGVRRRLQHGCEHVGSARHTRLHRYDAAVLSHRGASLVTLLLEAHSRQSRSMSWRKPARGPARRPARFRHL